MDGSRSGESGAFLDERTSDDIGVEALQPIFRKVLCVRASVSLFRLGRLL